MLLGQIIEVVGDKVEHTIDYSAWLARGETLASVSFTVDSGTATVTNVTLTPNQKAVRFYLSGGTLGDQFNVISTATTSIGQVKMDHIGVSVQTNGGPVFLSSNQTLMQSIMGATGPQGMTGGTGGPPPGYPADPANSTPAAKGDMKIGAGGAVTGGATTFSQTDGFVFTAADVGKVIWIFGGGANGFTLKTTIAALLSSTQVTLGAAAVGSIGPGFSYVGSAGVATPGTGVAPGDTFSFNSGTASQQPTVTVSTTKVVSATVNNGGSGGVNGTAQVYGTTGTGTQFSANVTISGGAITAINNILAAGHYTVNPTSLSAEPVTGASLSGATLTVVMGIDAASVSVQGNFSVQPSNPVTPSGTSGSGTGVTFNFGFTTTGKWFYATDDTAAIQATSLPVYTEVGKLYYSTLGETGAPFLPKRSLGYGQITDSGGFQQGPFFTCASAPPASRGGWSGAEAPFTGDLSNVQFPIHHFITGATTLGQPASGYQFTEECYPIAGFLYNSSGFNSSNSGNGGRTAACFTRIHVNNVGQGDAIAFNATGFVNSTRAGSTHFLANPAVTIIAGDTFAGADGVFLNPVELDCSDQGYDCAAAGYVTNLTRTNDRGNLFATWYGYRSQSTGTVPIDVHYGVIGAAKIGIDLTSLTTNTFGNWQHAAIAILGNDRIYLNAQGSTNPRYSQNLGTTYFGYSVANTAVQVIVNNSTAALFGGSISFVFNTFSMGADQNNRITAVGAANGSAPTFATTGTSDSNVDLFINPKGTGVIKVGSGCITANGTVGTTMTSLGPTGSHTTVQEWLTIKNSSGTVRYIPCY